MLKEQQNTQAKKEAKELAQKHALTFGKVLKQLRKDKEWSQEGLALAAEMDRSFLSEIERGVRQPTINTIFRLANALELKPSELVELVEDEI